MEIDENQMSSIRWISKIQWYRFCQKFSAISKYRIVTESKINYAPNKFRFHLIYIVQSIFSGRHCTAKNRLLFLRTFNTSYRNTAFYS